MAAEGGVDSWTKIKTLHEKNVAERGNKIDWSKCNSFRGVCLSPCFLAFLFSIAGAIVINIFNIDALSNGAMTTVTPPVYDFYAPVGDENCEDSDTDSWGCFYKFLDEFRPKARLDGLEEVDYIDSITNPAEWADIEMADSLRPIFNILKRMDYEFIEDDDNGFESDYAYMRDDLTVNEFAGELLRPRPDITAYVFGPNLFMDQMSYGQYWELADSILKNNTIWNSLDLTTLESRVEAIQYMLPTSTETAPYEEKYYNKDVMSVWVSFMLTWILGFIMTKDAALATSLIMKERQNGTKQLMEFLGLNQFEYWASQFYTQMTDQVLPVFVAWVLIIPILTQVDSNNDLGLGFSQCLYILFAMFMFMINVTLYAFAFSSLTRKASIFDAWSLVSSLMFGFIPIIFMMNAVNQDTAGKRLLLQLIPMFNFAFGVRDSYQGYKFDTIFFHFFDTLLWAYLTYYLDLTVPTLKGAQTRKCCYCCRRPADAAREADVELGMVDKSFEKENDDEKPFLVIKDLKKDFGNFTAVNGVSLELKSNQIYGLLGFNGAGKSTAINMITGQLAPTSGHILIDGHDVTQEIESLRKIMGVCPQTNILWDKLTVMEHMNLFGRLRGFTDEQIQQESMSLMKALEMDHRLHSLSSSLSGGEKRKLMVSAAFLGDPPFILLDEPTAGVDVDSRDSIQELILDRKKDKLIILTTHHMSEADYLSDDIAIMADGQIAITGNPTQLKVEHGKGTTFMLKSDTFTASEIEDKFNVNVTTDNDGYSIILCYDIEEVPSVLKVLEQHAEPGTIKIENNSLESVFLNLAMERAARSTRRDTMRRSSNAASPTADPSEKSAIQDDKSALAGYGTLDERLIANEIQSENGGPPEDSAAARIALAGKKRYTRPRCCRKVVLLSEKRLRVIYKDIAPIFRGVMVICFMAVLYSFMLNAIGWDGTPDDWAQIDELTQSDDLKIPVYGTDNGTGLSPELYENLFVTYGEYQEGDVPEQGMYDEYPQYGVWEVRDVELVIPSVLDAKPLGGGTKRAVAMGDSGRGEAVYTVESESKYVRCVNPEKLTCQPLYTDCSGTVENPKHTYEEAYEACIGLGDGYRLPTANEPTVDSWTGEPFCNDVGTDPSCSGGFWTSDREPSERTASVKKGITMQAPFYIGQSQSSSRYQYAGMDPVRKEMGAFSVTDYMKTIMAAFFFMLGSAMMVAALYKYTADEIDTGMFEQQELMGVSKWLMFIVSFFWDFVISLCAVILYILLTTPTWDNFRDTMKAWTSVSFSFLLSFYTVGSYMDYERLNTVVIAVIFIVIAFVQIVAPLIDEDMWAKVLDVRSDVFDPFEEDEGLGKSTAWVFRMIYYFIPPTQYLLSMVLFSLDSSGSLGIKDETFKQHWSLVFLYSSLSWLILFILSQQNWSKDPEIESLKVDKKDLKLRPNSMNATADTMSKVFRDGRGDSLIAVNRISFVVKEGRCMGVLGKNGAGKSTMMNMLSTLFEPTQGKGVIRYRDCVQDKKEIREISGICNQKNIYWDAFTVREHLTFFGQLRGVPKADIADLIHDFAMELKFIEHMDTKMDELSGGNKRKVALCTSILGASDVLYLDEPSAGVDPFARDEMKNVLVKLKTGRVVLFTSHTMEEAEIMCDDVVIMVKGHMEAEGEVNQMITDHSTGYTLQIDTSDLTPDQITEVIGYINTTLQFVTAKAAQKAELNYVVDFKVSLSEVFDATASLKNQFGCRCIIESANLGQLFKHVVREDGENITPQNGESNI